MKILATGDWQACVANLDRLEIAVKQMLTHLDGGTWFLHLGDLKEHFNPIDQRVTNFLVDAFTRIRRKAAGTLVVRGNHDSITTADGSPSCIPVLLGLGINNVADEDWMSVPLLEEGTSDKADVLRARIWMVPYFRDVDRQKRAFAQAHSAMTAFRKVRSVPNILAFHNEVSGCSLSNGFSRNSSGISLADMGARDYDLCLGGHIHKPQVLLPNVHYVGSPFAMDWSECNIQQRFMIITL